MRLMTNRNTITMPLLLAALGSFVLSGPLAAQDDRGWIGVQMMCADPCGVMQTNGVRLWKFGQPPMIAQVVPGSPAARAGLQIGDTILSIDGLDITGEEGGRRLGALPAAQPVDLVIRRNGRDLSLRLTPRSRSEAFGEAEAGVADATARWNALRDRLKELYQEQVGLQRALHRAEQVWQRTRNEDVLAWTEEQREVAAQVRRQIDSVRREMILAQRRLTDSLAARTLYVTPAPGSSIGLRVTQRAEALPASPAPQSVAVVAPYMNAVAGARFEACDEKLGAYFGVTQGLLVLQVAEGTPAAVAGLQPGDVLVAVNDSSVTDVSELRDVLGPILRDGESAVLEIVRKGNRETLRMASR